MQSLPLIILATVIPGIAIAQTNAAPQFTISTVAGIYFPGAMPEGALDVPIGNPNGIAIDRVGNLYFSSIISGFDQAPQNLILKVDPNGILTRLAGGPTSGFSGDGGPAANATFNSPTSLAIDPAGNLYISDSQNNRIRRVTPDGIISTIAGTGAATNSGDNGPALQAGLSTPTFIALDPSGNLYVAVAEALIRKISPDGNITLVAGNGQVGYTGDGGPATSARIGLVWGMAVDPTGNVYFSDAVRRRNHLRKITPDGTITTVNANTPGFSGDAGPVGAAQFDVPQALAVDSHGNLFIGDVFNNRIRMVNTAGIVTTVAGNGTSTLAIDGVPATSTGGPFANAMTTDPAGNLYIADGFQVIRKLTEGIISTIAGTGQMIGGSGLIPGDGGAATLAMLASPTSVALNSNGFLAISDTYHSAVRFVSGDGRITTIEGNNGAGGPGLSFNLNLPGGLLYDSAFNLYTSDSGYNRILMLSSGGKVIVLAGSTSNIGAFGGDGGPAVNAQLNFPKDIARDAAGNLYIADTGNNRIRKVTTDGIINTIAGGVSLNTPTGIALDAAGNLYIADTGNYVVRKLSPDGTISTIAGTGAAGHSGDGGPATAAQLSYPTGIRLDPNNNLFIADGAWVRMISLDGTISTIAGNGALGITGDGGPATNAQLGAWGLAVDPSGNIYVADPWDNTVRFLKR